MDVMDLMDVKHLPLVLLLILPSVPIAAEPFIPKDDSIVLERLPRSASADPEIRRLRAELAGEPENLSLATDLAWRFLAIARGEGDPRWNGYAQAVLSPWWDDAEPPPAVLLLRATLAQNRHDFRGALEDLSRLLRADPRNRQAWLTRAMVLQVSGDLRGAHQSCQVLWELDRSPLSHACLAHVASLTGQAEASYELLERTRRSASGPIADRVWSLTTLAQIAERLGRSELAESHYEEALALGARDVYLLAAYADFLLDRERPREAAKLLEDEERADALYLRRGLAAHASDSPDLERYVRNLEARFAAARLRGDETHLGSESRFTLQLLDRPAEALELALRNWAVQKEPVDARLVLEAARAAGRPDAARPVESWLEETGLEDVRLARLLDARKETGP